MFCSSLAGNSLELFVQLLSIIFNKRAFKNARDFSSLSLRLEDVLYLDINIYPHCGNVGSLASNVKLF